MTITRTYKILLPLATAIAVIGWAVAYGYEDHQLSECRQLATTLSETNQARIKNSEGRTVKIRAREKSLQARTNELIRTLNGPDSNESTK
jgi:hypothetical protein